MGRVKRWRTPPDPDRPPQRFLLRAWRGTVLLKRGVRLSVEILLLGALGIAFLDIWCETRGLPDVARDMITAYLSRRGLLVELGVVRAGLRRGIEAENVRVYDGRRRDVMLAAVDRLKIPLTPSALIGRTDLVGRIIVSGADVWIPSPPTARGVSPATTLIRLHVQRATLTPVQNRLVVDELRGALGPVRLAVSGIVSFEPPPPPKVLRPATPPKAIKRDVHKPSTRVPAPAFSLVAIMERLPADLATRLQRFMRALLHQHWTHPPELTLAFDLHTRRPRRNRVRARLSLPRTSIRGCAVGPASVAVWYTGGLLHVHIGDCPLGPSESARADVRLDVFNKTWTVEAAASLFPKTAALLADSANTLPAEIDTQRPFTVSIRAQADRWRMDAVRAAVGIRADDILWRRKPIADVECDVDVRWPVVIVRRARAVVFPKNGTQRPATTADATGRFRLDSHTFTLDLKGLVDVPAVFELAGIELPAVFAPVHSGDEPAAHSRVRFVSRGTYRGKTFDASGNIVVAPLHVGAFTVARAEADFQVTPSAVRVERVIIDSGPDNAARVEGRLSWAASRDARAGRIRGRLEGTVVPDALQTRLPPPLRERLQAIGPIRGQTPAVIALDLIDFSPEDPCALQARCSIKAPELRFRALPASNLTMNVKAGNKRLHFCPVVRIEGATPDRPQTIESQFDLDIDKRTVAGRIIVRADPALLYSGITRKRPPRVLRQLKFPQSLPTIVLTLPATVLPARNWTMRAAFDAVHLAIEDVALEELHGDADIMPDSARVRIRRTRGPRTPAVALTIDARLDREDVRIDGSVTGDPRCARPFLGRKTVRVWDSIFENFHWNPSAYPDIQLHRLHIHRDPTSRKQIVEGSIDVVIRAFRLREAVFDRLDAGIEVRVPHRIDLHIRSLSGEGCSMAGTAAFIMDGRDFCDLAIRGTLQADYVVPRVLPGTARWFRQISVAPETVVSISGCVPLRSGAPPLLLDVAAGSPAIKIGPVSIEQADLHLKIEKNAFQVVSLEGKAWDGPVAVQASWDDAGGVGKARIKWKWGDLTRMLADLAPGGAAQDGRYGRLKLSVQLDEIAQISQPQKPPVIRLRGRGEAVLRGANLWHIPVLSELQTFLQQNIVARVHRWNPLRFLPGYHHIEKITDLEMFGRITKVRADLVFAGDRVQFRNIETNGEILPLSGAGTWWWQDDRADVFLRALPLRRSRIVPFLWKHLSWFFMKGVRGEGKPGRLRWRPVTEVGDLVGGVVNGVRDGMDAVLDRPDANEADEK